MHHMQKKILPSNILASSTAKYTLANFDLQYASVGP